MQRFDHRADTASAMPSRRRRIDRDLDPVVARLLNLGHTAGNRAVAGLLAPAIQRLPDEGDVPSVDVAGSASEPDASDGPAPATGSGLEATAASGDGAAGDLGARLVADVVAPAERAERAADGESPDLAGAIGGLETASSGLTPIVSALQRGDGGSNVAGGGGSTLARLVRARDKLLMPALKQARALRERTAGTLTDAARVARTIARPIGDVIRVARAVAGILGRLVGR